MLSRHAGNVLAVMLDNVVLPNLDELDSDALKALIVEKHILVIEQHAELVSNKTEIDSLKLLILKLQRMQFGTSSEKLARHVDQLQLRLEDLETNRASQPASSIPAADRTPRKPARRPLPSDLPRETETLQPKENACPDCGGRLSHLGDDVCETLEFVPGRFKVIRTVRPKLSCQGCDRIVQEPAPHRPIERGLAGPGLLAHVIVAKYCHHLPLYRQSEIYAHEGLELDRSTLADWVGGVSRTMEPLVDAIRRYVLGATKLHGDDIQRRQRLAARRLGQRAARKRQRFGLHTRRIANRNIPRITWQGFAEHCKPTDSPDSIDFMRKVRSVKPPVGRMSAASFMIFMRRTPRRSPKKLSNGSPCCTESKRRFAVGLLMSGNKCAVQDHGLCWNRYMRGSRYR